MSGPTLCFIDTETTGLDPDQHEVWEVACVIRSQTDAGPVDIEHAWQLPVDLARADPMALNIGHFHERRHRWASDLVHRMDREQDRSTPGTSLRQWAHLFAKLTWGAHMIGMVPSFDTDRLWRLLRANGACPGWHYQPVDVETLAVGAALGAMYGLHPGDSTKETPFGTRVKELTTLPWSSDELSRWYGLDPDFYERHSALGDARWARDLWDAVHEGVAVDG